MPITIPDPTKLRAEDPLVRIACEAAEALAAAGPIAVRATQNASAKTIQVEAATAAKRGAFIGYNLFPTGIGQQPTALSGVIIVGFAGVTPASPVYIAADGTLTQTAPTTTLTDSGDDTVAVPHRAIGVGVASDAIYFDPVSR